MAKTDPKPIRFTEAQANVLQEVAAACHVSEQDVARWAVQALGDYWSHHGKRLLLPLRFNETFRVNVMPLPGETVTLRMPPRAQQESGSVEDRDRTRRPVRRVVRKG